MNVLQNNSAQNRYFAKSSLRPINFYCAAPRAHSVELVGDFNHWRPFPMQRSVDGWWSAQVELCHGHHQYRFLVDGNRCWIRTPPALPATNGMNMFHSWR
ncbi:MAG: glycoside hydrolase family 13 [Limisphaerales bacterium]